MASGDNPWLPDPRPEQPASKEQLIAWAGGISETAGFITDAMDQAIPPIQNDVRQEIDQKIGAIKTFADQIIAALDGEDA